MLALLLLLCSRRLWGEGAAFLHNCHFGDLTPSTLSPWQGHFCLVSYCGFLIFFWILLAYYLRFCIVFPFTLTSLVKLKIVSSSEQGPVLFYILCQTPGILRALFKLLPLCALVQKGLWGLEPMLLMGPASYRSAYRAALTTAVSTGMAFMLGMCLWALRSRLHPTGASQFGPLCTSSLHGHHQMACTD